MKKNNIWFSSINIDKLNLSINIDPYKIWFFLGKRKKKKKSVPRQWINTSSFVSRKNQNFQMDI